MKPVEQTYLTYPDGNCFAACVASVLELPLEAVPDFKGEGWLDRWQEWLAKHNLTFVNFHIDPADEWRPPGYSLLAADSPRGAWLHSVVCHNGTIVFDPHPERHMGVGKWQEWTVFVVLDPSKPVRITQDSEESQ
jgi:hypothetical protein